MASQPSRKPIQPTVTRAPYSSSSSIARPPTVSSHTSISLATLSDADEKRASLSQFGAYVHNSARDSYASLYWDEEKNSAFAHRSNRMSVINALTSGTKAEDMSMDEIKAYLLHFVNTNKYVPPSLLFSPSVLTTTSNCQG